MCRSHPFLYFPVFYSMKAGVEGKPLSYAVRLLLDFHLLPRRCCSAATLLLQCARYVCAPGASERPTYDKVGQRE